MYNEQYNWNDETLQLKQTNVVGYSLWLFNIIRYE